MRPDLPVGVQAAQITHAAGESSPGNLPGGTYAVVLTAVPHTLLELEQKLKTSDVAFTAIRENGGEWDGELMAIGVMPGRRSMLKKHFSSLPLLR